MAPDRWVVNASPLILLGKVERIQLFGALAGDIALPRAVIREVGAKPGGERTVQTLTTLESAIVVDDEVPPANTLSWDLGPGETQVISYADMTASPGPAMPKSIWSSKSVLYAELALTVALTFSVVAPALVGSTRKV